MKTITFVAAALSGLVATATIAAPSETRSTTETEAAAVAPGSADTKPYCVKQTPTGSRVPRKLCQTRAQWAAQGVDVDNMPQ